MWLVPACVCEGGRGGVAVNDMKEPQCSKRKGGMYTTVGACMWLINKSKKESPTFSTVQLKLLHCSMAQIKTNGVSHLPSCFPFQS